MGGDYELILVDDGSTDCSRQIIEKYAQNENVIVVYQKNGGVSSARNAGLKKAHGEYVTFVDADDEVIPRSLDLVIPYLKSGHDIYIAGAIKAGKMIDPPIFGNVVFENQDSNTPLMFILTGGAADRRIPAKATQFMSGCKEKFYRRQFLCDNNLYFSEKLNRNEDVLFSCYCYYLAESIHFLPVTVYINKEDPNGITKGMDVNKTVYCAAEFIKLFCEYFQGRIDKQFIDALLFQQSLIVNYEAYRACKIKRITKTQFLRIMNSWYRQSCIQEMLLEYQIDSLSNFKKIAYLFMKMRLYGWIGFEMSVHHRYR